MSIENIASDFFEIYNDFLSTLSPMWKTFVTLFIFVLLVLIYSIFVWKFYRFIGTRNIFSFNLNQYNKASRSFFTKLLAGIFYLIEYVLIIPFIIFFWYVVFTFFMILLAEASIGINTILLISAVAIASIRMATYIPKYGENLAKELSKILPFTFLGIAVLNPLIFTNLADRVFSRLIELPLFFSGIINYFLFILILEILLRLIEFVLNILGIEEVIEEKSANSDE